MQNKNENSIWQFLREKRKNILIILGFLFSFFAALGVCYIICEKTWSEEKFIEKLKEQYPLLSPARELYAKSDLIVNVQPLRDELNEIGKDPQVSIYFEFLNTGANISVNKDLTIWPASLMKIPIAMAVVKKIEKGQWKMDSELVLLESDKDDRFGELYKQPIGTRFSIEKLLDEMLTKSDNTARTMLMRNLEKKDIDDVLEHLGIEDIFNSENKITAKKYSIFWRSLYASSYLSEDGSQKLIELMSKSQTNEYLSSGLPQDIIFSHKIGVIYEDNIYADSGIVYVAQRPYILTVMTQGHKQKEAEEIIKKISSKVYDYVSEY